MTSVETRLELVEKNAIIKGIADVVLGGGDGDWSQNSKNSVGSQNSRNSRKSTATRV